MVRHYKPEEDQCTCILGHSVVPYSDTGKTTTVELPSLKPLVFWLLFVQIGQIEKFFLLAQHEVTMPLEQ